MTEQMANTRLYHFCHLPVTTHPNMTLNFEYLFYRAIFHAMGNLSTWLCLLIVPVVGLIPRFVVKVFSQRFCASDIQIAREAEKNGTFSDWEFGEIEMNQLPGDHPR